MRTGLLPIACLPLFTLLHTGCELVADFDEDLLAESPTLGPMTIDMDGAVVPDGSIRNDATIVRPEEPDAGDASEPLDSGESDAAIAAPPIDEPDAAIEPDPPGVVDAAIDPDGGAPIDGSLELPDAATEPGPSLDASAPEAGELLPEAGALDEPYSDGGLALDDAAIDAAP